MSAPEPPPATRLPSVWHDYAPEGAALEALRTLLEGMDDLQAVALEASMCHGRNKKKRLEQLNEQLTAALARAERLLYELHTACIDQRMSEAGA
jgi:hypothetical protein